MIELKQVSLRFHNRLVLNEVNLQVKAQQALSIIGPSGAGKSMLLKMIAGLVQPSEGLVKVNSSKISMLFQKNALFDSYSVLNNLLLPLSETLKVRGSEAKDKAVAMLKAVGLEQSLDAFPDQLSGGMQKRLGIARALIIDPEVILYDEPTAGLDPITSKSIAELIMSLHKMNETTLVMVTNDLQRAYQVSDVIAFCTQQTLRVVGSPSEVKKTAAPDLHEFIYASALTPSFEKSNP